jgi:hypothetical protein
MFKKLILLRLVVSKSILDDASVACPHKAISIFGVKNRIVYELSDSFLINAVSEKPISVAMLCIVELSRSLSVMQTAAGLPLNFSFVNESTKYVFIVFFLALNRL